MRTGTESVMRSQRNDGLLLDVITISVDGVLPSTAAEPLAQGRVLGLAVSRSAPRSLHLNVMGMRGAASGEGANADVTCLGDRRTVRPSKILRRKGDIYRFLATR